MSRLATALRRLADALDALCGELHPRPQAALQSAPALLRDLQRYPQAPPELREHVAGRRISADESELLARYAGQHDDDKDPDALDLDALCEQGRVAIPIALRGASTVIDR